MKNLITLVLFLATPHIFAAKNHSSEETTYKIEPLSSGHGIIWSIEFLSNNEIIFSEKAGKLKIFNLKTKKVNPIANPPKSHAHGQGGLLDIMLHPEFPKNKTIYFSYTKKVGTKYTTAVSKGIWSQSKITNLNEIFVANNASTKELHFGSRLTSDGQFLFFSVGDRGTRENAQDLSADPGKIHRLNLDGSTPKDNPFYNQKKAQKSIWSYGHRNPQGLVYDQQTNTLWEQEHGPRGGDEINWIEKGANYGWPVITYGKEYYGPSIGEGTHKKGMKQPIYHYTPSIAPCGLDIYHGDKFPQWKGDLFSGALKLMHINHLNIKNKKAIKETRLAKNLHKRIRDIKQGPDDLIYFSTDSGEIYRLTPQAK